MYLPLLAVWAACLLVAWVGAGSLALRILALRDRSWALSGVAGAVIFVLIGGWLNLAGQVRPSWLFVLVLIGDLLFVADRLASRSAWNWLHSFYVDLSAWGRILASFCGVGLLIAATNSLTFAKFSTFDDLPAYLTFPVKLLQLGSLSFDPVSERRVQSGLGANYFLQAFMLIAGDVRSLWFPDAGAGLILFTGCVLLAGAGGLYWIVARRGEHADQVSALLLACGLCVLPLSVSVVGASLLRYTAPFGLPCCLLLIGSLLGLSQGAASRRRLLPLAYVYAGALLVALDVYGATHSHFDLYLPDHRREDPNFFTTSNVVLEPSDLEAERQRAVLIQAALPAGESVYANFMVTFPMDFRRNPIYIADFPGMASLPPGMPTQKAPEPLRLYLLTNHVRYIAYSEKLAELQARWGPGLSPLSFWPRMQFLNSADVDQEIEAMARTNRVIFDDGDVRVIELSK